MAHKPKLIKKVTVLPYKCNSCISQCKLKPTGWNTPELKCPCCDTWYQLVKEKLKQETHHSEYDDEVGGMGWW